MTKRVFFSFHYQRDIWRVNQVRNSYQVRPGNETANFWDNSLWEKAKLQGDAAIQKLIDDGLKNSSVTAVLIGYETFGRRWVEYEIIESWKRGNGLLGIYIHQLKNREGYTDYKGRNPFENIKWDDGRNLAQYVPTYDWVANDGYSNMATWVENAPIKPGS